MPVHSDTRRRVGRAAAFFTAAAAVTGTWGLASAATHPANRHADRTPADGNGGAS